MSYLLLVVSQQENQIPYHSLFLAFVIYLRKDSTILRVRTFSNTVTWLPSRILECILYQFHRSLKMKLIDLPVRHIERVGRFGSVSARSPAIARVSLKGLHISSALNGVFNGNGTQNPFQRILIDCSEINYYSEFQSNIEVYRFRIQDLI